MHHPVMTRRRWIAGIAGALVAGTAVDAFAVEPNLVSVTRHRVGASRGHPARITQLTDLHLQAVGRHEARIAEAVAGLQPDLIVFTGDSVDDARNVDLLADFVALLPVGTPKLAILGNWEHWAGVDLPRLTRMYERGNCRLLRNESVVIPLAGAELLVTGLDDLVGGAPDIGAALRGVEPRADHLLLAHCPTHRDVFSRAARPPGQDRAGIDPRLLNPQLMLAGHTHGGQIAPFGWAPLRPRGSGRYTRGWYRDAAIPLYVSRGLGTSVIPARFCAPPEVAHFEWSLSAG